MYRNQKSATSAPIGFKTTTLSCFVRDKQTPLSKMTRGSSDHKNSLTERDCQLLVSYTRAVPPKITELQ